MRKILALLFALLASPAAHAGVSCALPFNLTNGTTADASQVMANYNALVTCLSNAAAAGANSDITSLSALTTPITPTQGGTPIYTGGTTTGTNTQILSSVTPSSFSLSAGRQVSFIAGTGNTGPTTLNVASTGNVNLFRRTQLGISAMVGGELVAGHAVVAEYDGTEFICLTCGPYLVGEIRNFAGSTSPAGWLFIDGSCQVRATYPDLFSVISTNYDPTGSTCDTAHFALPDGRGRLLAGQDNMGTNGAANRITSGGSGCTGTTLGGAGCGAQNHTQTISEMPSHTHTANVNDPGHTHAIAEGSAGGGTPSLPPSSGPTGTITSSLSTTGITVSNTNTGGGNPMTILNPIQIVTKIIKL